MKKNTSVVSQAVGKRGPSEWIVPLLMLLPSLALFTAFSYYPFAKTILNSFSVTTVVGDFISWAGVDNWIRVFNNPVFGMVIRNTFFYAALDLVISFSISMLFAVLSARVEKGSKWYQLLYALPMCIGATAIAAVWIFVYRQEAGLLNQMLGTENAWLRNKDTAIYAVAVAATWSHVAGRYMTLLVGFRNVSDDLIEAAKIDGAGWWTRTFRIMIPMASPQIFYVLFTSIIGSFKTFTQIKLLTGGGPAGSTTTLMYTVYANATSQIETACCYALILFVIIFIATRIQFAFEKKMVFYQ